METFAARLKYAMEQAGMKQRDLAEKIGAPKSAISQYLAGKNIPNTERMQKLAEVTGVSVGLLKGEETIPTGACLCMRRVSVPMAAKCLGTTQQSLRMALRSGNAPFGYAFMGAGSHYEFHISPAKLRDYVGAEQFNAVFGAAQEAMA